MRRALKTAIYSFLEIIQNTTYYFFGFLSKKPVYETGLFKYPPFLAVFAFEESEFFPKAFLHFLRPIFFDRF